MHCGFGRALALAALALPVLATAQAVPLKPGQYEVKTTMSVRGQAVAPETNSRCLAAEQLASVEGVFNIRPMAGFCKLGAVTIASGKVSYTAECPNSMAKVEGTIGADSYSVVRTLTPKSGKGAETAAKFEGKWIGKCTGK
jgi:Protein of unknown function (DUF3617)